MSVFRWSLAGALLVAGLAFASLTAKPGGFDEVVAWAEGRIVEGRARVLPCPPLVGEGLPGDVREAYRAAARFGAAIDATAQNTLRELVDRADTTGEQARAAVAALPPGAVAALRRAARTRGTLFDEQLFRSPGALVPILDLAPLLDALLLTARHAGTPPQRVDAWLDLLSCGADLSTSPALVSEMFGGYTMMRGCVAADDGWLGALDEVALRRLDAALAQLDAAIPERRFPGWELVHLAIQIENGAPLSVHDVGLRSIWQTWQHGFSVRGAAAERVEADLGRLQAFLDEDADGERWPQRRLRLERLAQPERGTEALGVGLTYALRAERMRREVLARLRLLRMAVAIHLGDDVPQLDDPLGTSPLARRRVGDRLLLVSADPEVQRELVVR